MCHVIGKTKRIIDGVEREVTLVSPKTNERKTFVMPEYQAMLDRQKAPDVCWAKGVVQGEHPSLPGGPVGFTTMQMHPQERTPENGDVAARVVMQKRKPNPRVFRNGPFEV